MSDVNQGESAMANDEHVEIVKKGAAAIAEWHDENPEVLLDLNGANLEYIRLENANLKSANLCRARLTGADLRSAKLNDANLADAHMDGVRLSKADLSGANIIGAILRYADMREVWLIGSSLRNADAGRSAIVGAYLHDADLSGTNLSGANLSGSQLADSTFNEAISKYTIWGDLDLSKVNGLNAIIHRGPSTIGLNTIIESGGMIPSVFLEGCGVPDNWITYLPSLLGQPIDLYSCFISYSHQDEEFCKRLHSRMRADKLRVWYAPDDMKSGRKMHEQIDHAIRLHDKLLVVLSEHSINSNWVKTELKKARQREVMEDKRVLFPIRLMPFEQIQEWKLFDADNGLDTAAEIREYFIPDFTNWKDHDSFEEAYTRLMKDFKRDSGEAAK